MNKAEKLRELIKNDKREMSLEKLVFTLKMALKTKEYKYLRLIADYDTKGREFLDIIEEELEIANQSLFVSQNEN